MRIAERVSAAVKARVELRARVGQFAGIGADEAEALSAATLMRGCGDCQNVWHAEDLTGDAGELYEGEGTLYACNVRLCPSCMNARRRVARDRAREGMAAVHLAKGERWFLVTLTAPTLPARVVSLSETMRAIYDAWGQFTKHGAHDDVAGETVTWESLTRASIKGVEFTLGKRHKGEGRAWSPERDGYHVHIHLLAVARWVDAAKLRRAWSKCLAQAWERRGIRAGINTRDGLAVCHVRLVTDRKVRASGSVINIDGAVCEVAKYITKAESFLTIPEDQLIDVAAVRRWPRMFELLGACRRRRTKADERPKGAGDESAERYLDTKNLFSENLSSAEDARREQMKEALRAARARSIPLRSRGVALLMAGEGQLFEEELAAHVAEVRSYRRTMLSELFPLAKFRTLAGAMWFGTDKNPARSRDAMASYSARVALEDYNEAHAEEIEAEGQAAREEWANTIRRKGDLERRYVAAVAEAEEWQNWANGRKRVDGWWIDDLEVTNATKIARATQWEIFIKQRRAAKGTK